MHEALPASWYGDERQAACERDAIFRRSWQPVGLAADVAVPGSYLTADVGGMPVVVTRDQEGELHALLNVCPHRGMIVASGCGPAKLLQCPNHAWVFNLRGELRNAPRSEAEPGLLREGLDLRRAAVHRWGPLILVNLDRDAVAPLRELAVIDAGLAERGLNSDTLEAAGDPVEWDIAANWKVLVENYLECYHCPLVHPRFSKVFETSLERYAHHPDGMLLSASAPVRETSRVAEQQAILTTAGPVTDSQWHMLFPATTVNVYPGEGAVELTWYWPTGAQTSRGRTVILHPPGTSAGYARQVRELSLLVGAEDNELCEGMHRGLVSGAIDRPRLMEASERLVIAFQSLVREAVEKNNRPDGFSGTVAPTPG